jgi:hypothetical protein
MFEFVNIHGFYKLFYKKDSAIQPKNIWNGERHIGLTASSIVRTSAITMKKEQ